MPSIERCRAYFRRQSLIRGIELAEPGAALEYSHPKPGPKPKPESTLLSQFGIGSPNCISCVPIGPNRTAASNLFYFS